MQVLRGWARAESVTGMASTGVAAARLGVETEDTITLAVQWRNRGAPWSLASAGRDEGFTGVLGHATYTSSWIAPKADVHSQQRWFYMGHKGASMGLQRKRPHLGSRIPSIAASQSRPISTGLDR